MYKVLAYFTDLQDNNHPYNEGDTFPRLGLSVDEKRLKELSTTNNRRNIQLIEKIAEKQKEQPKYTKTEINRMTTAELRKLAEENEIENADDITGAELKKILISCFGL